MTSKLGKDREALEQLWKDGLSGRALLAEHSRLADELILDIFSRANIQGIENSVALVALGGYGRKELFPYSDIDLMILYHESIEDKIQEVADAILYPLWDTGLDIGHAVRTVEQSLSHAAEDYFFQVAMLDSRRIAGSDSLFQELYKEYKRKFVDGQRDIFVERMRMHRDRRRAKFGSHSYLLEPHLKEGKGGLRDIQAMFWVGKVVFGLDDIDEFVSSGLMLEEERRDFLNAWDTLVRLRNRLHYISRRKNDQLYFEMQEEVAKALGYVKRDGVLAVEQFMRETYAQMGTVAIVTDLFFDHVEEVLGFGRKGGLNLVDREIEAGIEVHNNRIQLVATQSQLEAKPHLLMRVFLASARTGAPIHHRTRKLIGGFLHLVTEKIQNSSRMAKAFISVLLDAKDIFAVLESMLETGLLQAYIPEFGRILTLAQHDVYHVYTVDRHSLQAVAELKHLAEEETQLYQMVKSPEILLLAALFHDIGKGSGKDHSEEGTRIVARLAARMQFSMEDVECLCFLIRYHLFIPENALRRDLNDISFIQRCTETIGDLDRLTMLYLLSIADSRATGPSAWSEWKASLMHKMYLQVRSCIESQDIGREEDEDLVGQVEQGVGWLKKKIMDLLEEEKGIIDLDELPADYILSFSPEMVAEHIRLHRDNYQLLRQKSLITAEDRNDFWSLLVLSKDRPGLLAKICGILTLHNLIVVKAQIFTWNDGTVVDVLYVRPTDGLSFLEKDWQGLNNNLDLAIAHRLGLGHRIYHKLLSSFGHRREVIGKVEPRVIIDNNSSDIYSVIEVYASDLPGLLYHITQTLADFSLNIHKAYIATEIEQLIDVFYVLDLQGRKVLDQDFQREIIHGLLFALGQSEK